MNLANVPLGKEAPEKFNVIIEIPRGSSNKYEMDKETGLIKLDRVFYSSVYYPLDYGFLPQTHWHDGDALDALVLTTHALLPGVLVEVKPIGVLNLIDNGDKDEKIIGVAVGDPRMEEYKDIDDLTEHLRKEIAHFYEVYKDLEGKKVQVVSWGNAEEAKKVIKEGMEMHRKLKTQS
ncbi:inorganic diphosphatase [Candidatus Azambacteria bacterium RIFCSPHIGHO2_02_FULL_52_12]|uniref:Inorganic pyrophosphatase n=1 Tax=Candidatus Azambacteria bacterium RIFCSPLOWO2_01_FULL_46_25 TaxID=1797298 RepID=A0A1F5BUC2_9BACT|nr:MAG: inorganic diphosphatase [Candidatus Azambacteria bacterium RIFCSPHIGHO2_02_FULL_52_12]OGD34200.1 MAG: inorganic diphosphatase [Candidatus Azambacteria bacterium RIFCSPLOWO2_01_FULL_46_25]OGD36876.1 MAG: inorganic diphosphatase [Candidatus Azambacteria bacterium RIFCSPHIGHO2_01_FULL_51_74]